MNEIERIKSEYKRREREIKTDYYSVIYSFNQFMYFQKARATIVKIKSKGLFPLIDKKICEI